MSAVESALGNFMHKKKVTNSQYLHWFETLNSMQTLSQAQLNTGNLACSTLAGGSRQTSPRRARRDAAARRRRR